MKLWVTALTVGALSFELLQVSIAARASDLLKHEATLHDSDEHLELPHSKHAQSEASYWEAREKAESLRKQLPGAALTSPKTDLTMFSGTDLRIWDFFGPDYTCPFTKERVGRIGDGGKWVCGVRALLEDRPCLIYSLGSRGDTSFEEEILSRTACEVHTFDPDVTQGIESALPGLHFHAIGIGRDNGTALTSLDDRKMHSIEQVMGKLGHKWVDVLKMDIEGHEWDVLSDVFAKSGAQLPTTQLLVEVHWPGNAERVWGVCPSNFFMLSRALQVDHVFLYRHLDSIYALHYVYTT